MNDKEVTSTFKVDCSPASSVLRNQLLPFSSNPHRACYENVLSGSTSKCCQPKNGDFGVYRLWIGGFKDEMRLCTIISVARLTALMPETTRKYGLVLSSRIVARVVLVVCGWNEFNLARLATKTTAYSIGNTGH
jgi:hypothetical protein